MAISFPPKFSLSPCSNGRIEGVVRFQAYSIIPKLCVHARYNTATWRHQHHHLFQVKRSNTVPEKTLLRLIISAYNRSFSPSYGERLPNANVLHRNMNPTLGRGLNTSASKRARSTDSARSLSTPPVPKASKTEDEEDEQADASVPAFLRQSKAGK